jgi:hypothetical protein
MKKKIIYASISGFFVGILIGYFISIVISLVFGGGNYYATPPELVLQAGGEVKAVLFQVLMSGIYGSIWAASSLVWTNEDWSILKMTATHFVINSISTFPIAWFTRWMDHSLGGVVGYFLIFIAIYFLIWLIIILIWRRKIKDVNSRLQEVKQ